MSRKSHILLGPAGRLALALYYAGIALLAGSTLVFAVVMLLMPPAVI